MILERQNESNNLFGVTKEQALKEALKKHSKKLLARKHVWKVNYPEDLTSFAKPMVYEMVLQKVFELLINKEFKFINVNDDFVVVEYGKPQRVPLIDLQDINFTLTKIKYSSLYSHLTEIKRLTDHIPSIDNISS